MLQRCLLLFLLIGLAACASQSSVRPVLPELRLAPAAFGGSVSLAQRLTVQRLPALAGQPAGALQSLDAQLEIDANTVQLAGMALGQRVLTLNWNGRDLVGSRHNFLPKEVDAAHVLRDVQLVYWPAEAVRAALPAGWTLQESASQRDLFYAGQLQVSISYPAAPRWQGRVEIDNQLEGYRMHIDSTETGS